MFMKMISFLIKFWRSLAQLGPSCTHPHLIKWDFPVRWEFSATPPVPESEASTNCWTYRSYRQASRSTAECIKTFERQVPKFTTWVSKVQSGLQNPLTSRSPAQAFRNFGKGKEIRIPFLLKAWPVGLGWAGQQGWAKRKCKHIAVSAPELAVIQQFKVILCACSGDFAVGQVC